MAFVPAANVAQVAILQTYSSQPVVNVLNFEFNANPTSGDLDALAADVSTWLAAVYAALKHTAWSVQGIRVRDLTTADAEQIEFVPGSPIAGAMSGTPLPGSIAMCLSLRTAFVGRTRRGRFYSTGHTAAQLEVTNANLFNSAAIDDHIDALEDLRADVATDGWTMCVVSRFVAGVQRTNALVTPVTAIISTDAAVDSQRGRVRS